MIPLKLTVENFKCYRRDVPTLQLEGIHMACLCGPNGHGKSSLLDAITWALWGDAVHRPQEELVHLGEQDMRVELEFMIGSSSNESQQNQRYRVIRRYSRSRRAGTDLQLQIATGTLGESKLEFKGIGGNSVRETEAYIRKLVGMDYDTFVNSAFLVQGRADEFTTKRPSERQKVLAEILGLGFYDRLQERAKQKTRECANQINLLQGETQALSQELARQPEYQGELPRIQADLTQTKGELAAAEQKLDNLRKHVESLKVRQQEMRELANQVTVAREELEQLQAQSTQHSRRIQIWEAAISRQQEVEQAYVQLIEYRSRDEKLNLLLEPYVRLQERNAPLEKQVENLPSLEIALSQAHEELSNLESKEEAIQIHKDSLNDMYVTRQTLQEENRRLLEEMNNLRSKVDMLSEGEARCPLCGTELGEGSRKHIATEYATQGKLLAQRHHGNTAALQVLDSQYHEALSAMEKDEAVMASTRRQLHGRIASLGQDIEVAKKAPLELKALRDELHRLNYDPIDHQEVKGTLKKLAMADEEHRQLQQALEGLPSELDSLKSVTTLAQRREQVIGLGEKQLISIQQDVEGLPTLKNEMDIVSTRYQNLQKQESELVARHGFLEARLLEYKDTEARKTEAEVALQGLTQRRELFEQLVTAFGRTGVQALLIEAAIPELEHEATRLLGRMTDNTMHLKLETQRETQRGEAVETLEINVADALGIRSYDTYSGGEAFRINLALRIALSKLLAHRAGAPLPTLFIDEGFGTQDTAGRERILDVIQSISEDFECILAITHLDDVKDAFPIRIEVEKTSNGSTFALT